MIKDEAKLTLAREIIERKVASCLAKKQNAKDEEKEILEKEYERLASMREEIYKGNRVVIEQIIGEAEESND